MEIIKEILRPGEELIYSERPANVKTFDAAYQSVNIRNLVLAVSITTIVCVSGYIFLGEMVKIAAILLWLLFVPSICLLPFLDANDYNNNLEYFFTNERIIIARTNDGILGEYGYAEYADLVNATMSVDTAGVTSMRAGSVPKRYRLARPSATNILAEAKNDKVKYIMLYAIRSPEAVKNALYGKLEIV